MSIRKNFGFTNAVIIKNNKIDVTSTGLSMTLRQDGEWENHYYQYGAAFKHILC